MIARILIALSVVIGCFYIPSFVDSPYTEVMDLLQDGIMSGAVIALMLWVVRGWSAILICIIEAFLIFVAAYYGYHFNDRHTLYLAINYTKLHDAAFFLELAIIVVRIITGLKEIGADYSRYTSGNTASIFDSGNRERHQ